MKKIPAISSRTDRKDAGSEQVRLAILEHAQRLLLEDGPHALSMRRLAERIGSSTIVLYSHFRDKAAILDAIFQQGFERLGQAMTSVPAHKDAMEHVIALGKAYRKSSLAQAAAYQVMFTRCVPGFEPSAAALEASRRCFSLLRDAVQAAEDAGYAMPEGVTQTAQVCWGTLHGLISLELFGYLGGSRAGEQRLEQALQLLRAGMQANTQLKDRV
jgi:AcrR family transcriptional regulator